VRNPRSSRRTDLGATGAVGVTACCDRNGEERASRFFEMSPHPTMTATSTTKASPPIVLLPPPELVVDLDVASESLERLVDVLVDVLDLEEDFDSEVWGCDGFDGGEVVPLEPPVKAPPPPGRAAASASPAIRKMPPSVRRRTMRARAAEPTRIRTSP